MGATTLGLATAAILGGLLIIVLGFFPAPETKSSTLHTARGAFRATLNKRLSPRRQLIAITGLIAGLLLAQTTGWWIYAIALPAGAIFVPIVLGADKETSDIERIDALETWARNLSGLTAAGATLEKTITASLPSVPEAIRTEVTTLVARINARWTTHDALTAFANELDDPTADLLVAHLILAVKMRGPGLTAALDSLSDALFEEVRSRRQIEADRAKPRQNVRIITLISAGMFCMIPFIGSFMSPYKTPLGQLLLAVWILAYGAILIWLQKTTKTRPVPRILEPKP